MKPARKYTAGDFLLPVLALALLLGLLSVFGPCPPREDGGWMTCHWAGQALSGLAAAMLIVTLLHLLPGRAALKKGLDLALLPMAALALMLPGHLISLCMMGTMPCRSVMTPAVTVFSVLLFAVAVIDLLVRREQR